MNSKPIEDFLQFLRDCEQQYHMAEADEVEAVGITNDILHNLELLEHDDGEVLSLGRDLIEARRKRRGAKDTIGESAPVLAWIEENRITVKSLERLLGEVRKAERSMENRIYFPRTKGTAK